MSEIKYKTGWIKDPEGNKFAPITTTDQVITSDGADLASEINNIKNDVTTLNSKYLDNIGESTKFTRFVLASGASHTLQKPAYRNMIFFMFRNNELGISSVDQWNASSNSNEKLTVKSTNEGSQVASEITVKNNHSVAVIVFAITFHAPGL